MFYHRTELTINKIRIDEIQQLQKQSIRCLVLLSCNTGRVNESNPNNRYDNIATEFAKITGNGLVVAPNGFCSYSNYRNSNIQLPFTCFLEIPGNIKYTYWRIYRGNNNRLYFNTQQSLLSMKYLIELIRLKGWVSL